MTTPSNPAGTSQLPLVLDRFDTAWQGNQPPLLSEFLTGIDTPTARRELLLELIPIDLEYRWRKYGARQGNSRVSASSDEVAGLPRTPCLRHYAERLPELGPLENLPSALFTQEYRVRRQFGEWHGPADFEATYPTLYASVGPLLHEMDRNLTAPPAARAADDPSRAPTFSIVQQSASLDTSPNAAGPAPSGSRTIGPGFQLGEYRLIERLGKGGMGEVFKAEHRRMQRVVALKVLPPERVSSPDAVQRFHREVVAIARLNHPNIVIAHDAGEDHGVHYLVMEYVPGADLARLVKEQGPLSVSKAVAYMLQAARGLVYTHEHGVIHRDLKPANFLLADDGTIKILDLGLARLQIQADVADNPEHSLTSDGDLMGTADFMAPEQALNAHKADARSDVYSLGCTLYYLLTGRRMYAGDTFMERVLAHQTQPIPSLRASCSAVPEELDTIFRKLVAKAPAERYQSMSEVVAALETLRPADLPETALIRSPKVNSVPRRSRRIEVAYGAVAVVALVIGLYIIYTNQRPKAGAIVDGGPPGTAVFSTAPTVNPAPTAPPSDDGEWSEPVNLGPVVNTEAFDCQPWLSADGLMLLFVSDRNGSQDFDLWSTERANLNAPWESPKNLGPKVNSHSLENSPWISNDGLTLLFRSDRDAAKNHKLWICRRGKKVEQFGDPAPIEGVYLSIFDAAPRLSRDGLTLLFTATLGNGDLWKCTRNSVSETFSRPMNLGEIVNSNADDYDPALSADELTLYLSSNRPGGRGGLDLWQSKRSSPSGAFGTPVNLGPAVNSKYDESCPSISADGCTLVFHSNRPGGFGKDDLWMSTRKPHAMGVVATPAHYTWPKDAPAPAIAPFNAEKAKEHQEAWAKYLGVKVEFENSIGMKFRLIPPGEFMMGSTEEEIEAALKAASGNKPWQDQIKTEGPRHKVILTQPYYLATTEVTQAQYQKITGQNPAYFSDSGKGKEAVQGQDTVSHPVEQVNWNDATVFCGKLSELAAEKAVDRVYRLPTEAEWENACRAGTTTKYSSGISEDQLKLVALTGNYGHTSLVGELLPNAFGLYDMHGNVWEWCSDWYGDYSGNAVDPTGAPSGTQRVLRGGAWDFSPEFARAAYRASYAPSNRANNNGFRVVLPVDVAKTPGPPQADTK